MVYSSGEKMTSGFHIPGPRRFKPYRPPNPFTRPSTPKPAKQPNALTSVSLVPDGYTLIRGNLKSEELVRFTGWKVKARYVNRSGKEISSTGEVKGINKGKLDIQINGKQVRHLPLNKIRIVFLFSYNSA